MVECPAVNRIVTGSSPVGGACFTLICPIPSRISSGVSTEQCLEKSARRRKWRNDTESQKSKRGKKGKNRGLLLSAARCFIQAKNNPAPLRSFKSGFLLTDNFSLLLRPPVFASPGFGAFCLLSFPLHTSLDMFQNKTEL